jgi:hypothetical protein
MPRRRYKSKWHRYGTIIGVLLVAIGGIIMIVYGAIALTERTAPEYMLVSNFIEISSELQFFWALIPVICGITILAVTVQQKPHENETLVWMVIALILGVIGGTLGGLIVFCGALIYLILYFI